MAGWDTLRGVGFQHAVALVEAIKLLEDTTAIELRVEGTADIIDVQTVTKDLTCSVQVRSRQEPYTWGPADLVAVVKAWLASEPNSTEELRFVSDGPLGRDAARKLLPAIGRVISGDASSEDLIYLAEQKLPADPAVLRRISFETRTAPTTALLTIAGLHGLQRPTCYCRAESPRLLKS